MKQRKESKVSLEDPTSSSKKTSGSAIPSNSFRDKTSEAEPEILKSSAQYELTTDQTDLDPEHVKSIHEINNM